MIPTTKVIGPVVTPRNKSGQPKLLNRKPTKKSRSPKIIRAFENMFITLVNIVLKAKGNTNN